MFEIGLSDICALCNLFKILQSHFGREEIVRTRGDINQRKKMSTLWLSLASWGKGPVSEASGIVPCLRNNTRLETLISANRNSLVSVKVLRGLLSGSIESNLGQKKLSSYAVR